MAGFACIDFIISARNKSLAYSPTNVVVEQEYWQSLSFLPSTAPAGLDKIKARVSDGHGDTSNAKGLGKVATQT